MSEYKIMDLDQWARKEHYFYYTEQLKIEYNVTTQIDVKDLLDFCHEKGYRFYPTFIYFVTKVLNRIDNFKMFRDEHGNLCVWDQILPNYTIFHKDDSTFSDCWTEYSEDFEVFYRDIVSDMEHYKDKKGIKVKSVQPSNSYCISCVPWITFTGYGSKVTNGEPVFCPILTIGKYVVSEKEVMMPINVTIAHAVADGYHVGMFFEKLQEALTKENIGCITGVFSDIT